MIHFVKYQLNPLILIGTRINLLLLASLSFWLLLSPGKVLPCICMPSSVEQESLSQLWCSVGMWPHAHLPCLVTHEYGSNWICWKQTSVNWEDNDDHGQLFRGPAFQRGDCSYPPLACYSQQEEVCGRLRSRRGRGSADFCAFFFFFCREEAIKQ